MGPTLRAKKYEFSFADSLSKLDCLFVAGSRAIAVPHKRRNRIEGNQELIKLELSKIWTPVGHERKRLRRHGQTRADTENFLRPK